MESNAREAIPYIDGNDIPIISKDALRTAGNLDRLVINIILVPFKLARRMDSLACPVYVYWCRMAMAGPCWVLMTPLTVTMGILVIWWLSIPLTLTVRSDFLMI